MAFSVTNIGVNTNATATVTVTYGGSNISGVLIFVVVTENSLVIGGSVTDNHSTPNTYTEIQSAFNNNVTTSGFGDTYYAKNASLSTSDVITFTKQGADQGSISACYITGADTSAPLDTGVTNKATGLSGTPSVTGGTAGTAGDLNVGVVTAKYGKNTTSFVQASGWAAPPNEANDSVSSSSNIGIDGGTQTNAGTSGLTYNPTIRSDAWACFICAFQPLVASEGAGSPIFVLRRSAWN